MFDFLIPLSPLLVSLGFVLWDALRSRDCPDCGAPLPIFYSPFRKTRRMWLAGGYLCSQCGCETDMAGRKVTAATPPAPFPVRHVVALVIVTLVGVGIG